MQELGLIYPGVEGMRYQEARTRLYNRELSKIHCMRDGGMLDGTYAPQHGWRLSAR
jgi:hypothetical protein